MLAGYITGYVVLIAWGVIATWCAYDYRSAYLMERALHEVTAMRVATLVRCTSTRYPHTPQQPRQMAQNQKS
jgi:hypothetical protein